ncbi:MAG: DctP family TRAP transporter solute-binding subunit [Desulfopila sp.]
MAILLLLVFGQSSHAQQPIVMKFSHVADEMTPKGQMALRFSELIAERLGKQVVVEVYPEGQLYDDNRVLEAMLLGDVQIAAPSVSKFAVYCPGMQVFDLPFLFKDRDAVTRFEQSAQGRLLLDALNTNGLIGLGYLNDGFKVLSAIKPLVVPEDAAGLRFRIQPSRVLAEQFNALGAIPIKKPFSQISTSLADKAIDGQENTWANIWSRRIFMKQPYITELHHGIVCFLVVVSADFWHRLDEPIRLEVQRSLEEAIAFGNALVEPANRKARQEIVASHRAEIVTLSEEERSQWKEAMRPVWRQFEQEMGKELIETASRSH